MDNLLISSRLHIGIASFADFSRRRRLCMVCGARKSKSGKKPPEKSIRNPQSQFEEPELTELSLGEDEDRINDDSFEQRLEAIRSSGMEKKQLQEEKKYGPIDYTAADNDKKDNVAVKVVAGLAVLGLVVSFAIGDFLPSASKNAGPKEANSATKQLSPEEEEKFKTEASKFEEVLKATPEDLPALEGAAVAYAELGEYDKAKVNLERLTKITPENVEALRLLGEVKSVQKDYEGSAIAYRQAIKASTSDSMELVLGLTEALIDDKKPGEAVDELLKIKGKLTTAEEKSPTQANEVNSPGETATTQSRKDVQTQTETDEVIKENQLDPVQLDLLLGRAYFAWNRAADALAMYDVVVKNHPNDFRGYLAKGVLLKEQGRKTDAERMFIQARYFAPDSAKSLVDKYK